MRIQTELHFQQTLVPWLPHHELSIETIILSLEIHVGAWQETQSGGFTYPQTTMYKLTDWHCPQTIAPCAEPHVSGSWCAPGDDAPTKLMSRSWRPRQHCGTHTHSQPEICSEEEAPSQAHGS